MAERFWDKQNVFLDSSGNPRAFGKLYTYDSETSNPHVTFSNNGLTIENLNPIILNLAGRLPVDVFGDAVDYKATITNANGTDSITIDPLHGIGDTADASFTASIPGAVPTTVNLRLDKAPVNAHTDFDAPDDGVTDAYSQLQAAATACVNDGQRQLFVPALQYMLGHTLNLSNIPVMCDGAISTTFKPIANFPDAYVITVDDTTGGSGGVDAIYENFRIHGNRANQSGTVGGIWINGNVLYNIFRKIRIEECSGPCVKLSKTATGYPTLCSFDNIRLKSSSSDGFLLDAGQQIEFRECAAESMGGTGWNITSADAQVYAVAILRCYMENVAGHGIHAKDFDHLDIVGTRMNTIGVSGSATHGIWIDGTAGGGRGAYVSGNSISLCASPHAGSRHYYFSSGGEHIFERTNIPLTSPYYTKSAGIDVTVRQNRTVIGNTMPDMFFTNTASIAGGVSRFVGPAAVAQSATQSDVRFYVNSSVRLAGIRADFTTNAGGSDTYTVTVYKNGSISTLTAVTAAGAGTISYTGNEVVQLDAGDYFTVQITASATATTIPANGMKLTIGMLA